MFLFPEDCPSGIDLGGRVSACFRLWWEAGNEVGEGLDGRSGSVLRDETGDDMLSLSMRMFPNEVFFASDVKDLGGGPTRGSLGGGLGGSSLLLW